LKGTRRKGNLGRGTQHDRGGGDGIAGRRGSKYLESMDSVICMGENKSERLQRRRAQVS